MECFEAVAEGEQSVRDKLQQEIVQGRKKEKYIAWTRAGWSSAAPKIRLLLLKKQLIAGAVSAGLDAGKRGQQGAQRHCASDQGEREVARNVVNYEI